MQSAIRFLLLALTAVSISCAQMAARDKYTHGIEALKQGEHARAEELALAALEGEGSVRSKALLGFAQLKQNRLDEALASFKEVWKEDPADIEGCQGLGWTYYFNGQYADARHWFTKQYRLAKKHRTNHWFMTHYSGRDKKLVESYLSDASYGLGLSLLALGEIPAARKWLEKALSYNNIFYGHESIEKSLAGLDQSNARL